MNINTIRNKFILAESIKKPFGLFLIAETKLDSTFAMNQFSIRGYEIFGRDRNGFGGDMIIYINENIYHPIFL